MRIVDIGFIYFPSVRAIAYANEFLKRGIAPKEIFILKKETPEVDRLLQETPEGSPGEFFPLDKNIISGFDNGITSIRHIDAADINSPLLIEELSKGNCGTYIFSGGGILKKDILSIGKKFIHVHPGSLPGFRGSTCFYYSILEEGSLYSSAFYMEEDLDKGDVLVQSCFRINYCIRPSERLFFDYIVDAYIRAVTLGKVLDRFMEGSLVCSPQPTSAKKAYFIAHPFLRHLAIKKINAGYHPGKTTGIFEC